MTFFLFFLSFVFIALAAFFFLMHIHMRVVRERDRLQANMAKYLAFVLASQIALKGPTADEVENCRKETMCEPIKYGLDDFALKYSRRLLEKRRSQVPSL